MEPLVKVLFVDDDPKVLKGIDRNLRHRPYQTFFTQDADSAISLLNKIKPQIIVTDEMMPGMTGTELLSLISNDHPSICRILMSGKPTLDMAVNAINQSSIYRFLPKPFSFELLNDALDSYQSTLLDAEELLINQYKMQLEEKYPGITQIKKSANGAIYLSDEEYDYYDILQRIEH